MLFNFNKRNEVSGNYFDAYNKPSSRGMLSYKRFNSVTSQVMNTGGASGNSGGSYSLNRINPVMDRLDEPSIIDDWIGKDASSIDKMYRIIYLRDSIAGPTVDLMSRLPWSNFVLTGISDEKMLQTYQDSCDALNIVPMLPSITTEYLMLGKMVASLLFDESSGIWKSMIPHDPDMLRIEPRPVLGFDPKVDLKSSPAMQKFIRSQDPRDLAAKGIIPPGFLSQLSSTGYIPLEPDNTIYLARRVTPYDMCGTSYLTRIVPYWALEKALLTGTAIQARRRQKELLHITAGIDGVWEPTSQEMDYLAMLFVQGDEDPNGGAVATRTGVSVNEIGNPGGGWKISDEADYLNNGKMRALCVNESFLSGDSSYSTLEATMSIIVEILRSLRDEITAGLFYNRIFKSIAIANEFYEVKHSDVAHRIKVKKNPNEQKLIIPKVTWSKALRPEADSNYLDILDTAEGKGVPIGLKTWAAAAGVDITAEMANMEEDMRLRQQISEMKGEQGGDNAGNGAEASVLDKAIIGGYKPIIITAGIAMRNPEKALKTIPLFDKQNNFMQLSFAEANKALDAVIKNKAYKHKDRMLNCIKANLDGNQRKVKLMSYVLARCGIGLPEAIDQETVMAISNHILENKLGDKYLETSMLRSLTSHKSKELENNYKTTDMAIADKKVKNDSGYEISFNDPIPRDSPLLLSGLHTEQGKLSQPSLL